MNDLTFTEYQERAATTAVYPGGGTIIGLMYCGLGLGEAGEVQNKIKKVLRDDNGNVTEERREAILEEIGGVLWYCANACKELGAQLGDVAAINLAILRQRQLDGTISGDGDRR